MNSKETAILKSVREAKYKSFKTFLKYLDYHMNSIKKAPISEYINEKVPAANQRPIVIEPFVVYNHQNCV